MLKLLNGDGFGCSFLPAGSSGCGNATTTAPTGAQPAPASAGTGYIPSAGPPYGTQSGSTYDPQTFTSYNAFRGSAYDAMRGQMFDAQRTGYDP
ncbi:unnamed protein product [Trifolium pratense]|uniref:Uncharacterized protein n=1 Tax=Trifolium pratense TaxID=57577 RepID=A0ACB0IL05_TRIPR|nr:unnamed protein product [Trifolium pratense]